MRSAKMGATFFGLWGLLHVVGGGAMLATSMSGISNGFGIFLNSEGSDGPLANAILQYHSFNILWFGAVATVIAVTMNWKNSRAGLYFNLAITGLADVGLILFMLIPGYLSWANGAQGIVLFLLAAAFSIAGVRSAK
jgi:hypothetical protein